MNGRAEKFSFLRRNVRLRHLGQTLLKPVELPFDKRMEIADELLRLKNTVNETITIGVAHDADTRIRHAIDRHKLQICDLGLVFVQFSATSRTKTDFRPILDKRQKKIPLRCSLDRILRTRRENAAFAYP